MIAKQVTHHRRLDAAQERDDRVRHELDLGVRAARFKAEQKSRDAEQPRDLAQLVTPQLDELRVGIRRLRNVVGLEPARENCGVVRVADAAVPPVPLRPECLAGLGVELAVGREDEAGASPGSEEPRAVNLAGPCQSDGVLALLDNADAVDAVVGRAANLEDERLVQNPLGAFVLAVLVAEFAVLDPLDLHAARVQRLDLARLQFRERIAPEVDVHDGLLSPFKTRLPAVRSVVKLAVQGEFAGESLATTGRPLQHVQRQARHRLSTNP